MSFCYLSHAICYRYGADNNNNSFDECRLSAEMAANPQTKPTDLDCKSARNKWQLPSTSTILSISVRDSRSTRIYRFLHTGRVRRYVALQCRAAPRKAERHRITQRIRRERNLTSCLSLTFQRVKCRTHSNVKKHKPSRRSAAG